MAKGFWNYTEKIEFEVVNVEIFPVAQPVTHWQNAFVGTVRQAVKVTARGGTETFLMDNEDGSGLRKIARDGGPDSHHREIQSPKGAQFLPVAPEHWNTWDIAKYYEISLQTDEWMEKNHPEAFAKIKELKKAGALIPFNSHGRGMEKEKIKFFIDEAGNFCHHKDCSILAAANLGSVECATPQKQLSKKKIKKNAQKARRRN